LIEATSKEVEEDCANTLATNKEKIPKAFMCFISIRLKRIPEVSIV
jgi:hypothetical protein